MGRPTGTSAERRSVARVVARHARDLTIHKGERIWRSQYRRYLNRVGQGSLKSAGHGDAPRVVLN